METLEYHFALFRNEEPSAKGSAALCSTTCRLLGAEGSPLFCSVFEGLRGSITSQIAVKMSSDAAIARATEIASTHTTEDGAATEVVRESFKSANSEVYQYGHRMGAGGKMGATGLIAGVAGAKLAVGRVGAYEGFLCRDRSIVPIFEPHAAAKPEHAPGMLARFIGANAQILVDLAAVKLKDNDLIVLTTLQDNPQVRAAVEAAAEEKVPLEERARMIARAAVNAGYGAEREMVVVAIRVGRPTIMLREVVE
ncbi:MAG: PP2C family serine/threonine-protein phosphatase [Bdellovibrionota bacterium]